jgi:large subunit ribosomal protein L9
VTEAGFTVEKRQIVLDRPIKNLGLHAVRVVLHPEVSVTVTANIAQSAEEARMQAQGIDPLAAREEEEAGEPFSGERAARPAESEGPA